MENEITKRIEELSKCDPLRKAEEITKKSYKTSESTASLGFLINLKKSKEMDDLMEKTDDTKFSESAEDYLRKVLEIGFRILLEEDFISDGNSEKFYVLFKEDDGIILTFDTFHGSRNGASMYYNWRPDDLNNRHHCTSSGSFLSSQNDNRILVVDKNLQQIEVPKELEEPSSLDREWSEFEKEYDVWKIKWGEWLDSNQYSFIWVGDHDARESIKHNIQKLKDNGTLFKSWFKSELRLNHHGDWKDLDDTLDFDEKYKKPNEKSKNRIAKIALKLPINFLNDKR